MNWALLRWLPYIACLSWEEPLFTPKGKTRWILGYKIIPSLSLRIIKEHCGLSVANCHIYCRSSSVLMTLRPFWRPWCLMGRWSTLLPLMVARDWSCTGLSLPSCQYLPSWLYPVGCVRWVAMVVRLGLSLSLWIKMVEKSLLKMPVLNWWKISWDSVGQRQEEIGNTKAGRGEFQRLSPSKKIM